MKYAYWLTNIQGFGDQKCHCYAKDYFGAKRLYEMSENEWKTVAQVKEQDIVRLRESKKKWNLNAEWEKFLTKETHFITRYDALFPSRLLHLEIVPFALYYKGELPPEDSFQVAIVGARMCTNYGKTIAVEIGKFCAHQKVGVISGLARGIDTAAQGGALKAGGNSYGILGGGVNVIYPPENKRIYQEVSKSGALISQYPPDYVPRAQCFTYRNRIISGLADAVIIVEARERSGSLITADFALAQGKDVYAVPGRIDDPLSIGCNQLIHQGAQIVTTIDSLFEDMKIFNGKFYEKSVKNKIQLDKEELLVYSCLGLHPLPFSQIFEETKLPIGMLVKTLTELMNNGFVVEYYKNYYCRSEI